MRRTLYSSGWSVLAAGAASAAGLVVTAFTARVVGLGALGDLGVILTVSAVVAVVESSRIQDLTAQFSAGATAGRAWGSRHLVALMLVLLIAVAVLATCAGTHFAITAAAVWSGAVVQVVAAPVTAGAQAHHRFDRIAGTSILGLAAGLGVLFWLGNVWGLPGVGVGLLASSVVSRGLLWLVTPERRLRAQKPPEGPAEWRNLLSLLALNGIAQILNLTDITTVRGLAGPTEAGRYRAGVQPATQVIGLLYRGYDVLLPTLATGSDDDAASVVRRASRVFSLVVGVVLGAIVAERDPICRLLLGRSDRVASIVLSLFAATWVLNNAVHGASLLLIARRRQGAIVRLVVAEYLANAILTIALVAAFGAVGSALATLATLAVSNLLVLPSIVQREVPTLPARQHIYVDCLLPSLAAGGGILLLVAVL